MSMIHCYESGRSTGAVPYVHEVAVARNRATMSVL